MPLPINANDAMALSDRAWEIIDPEGLHEGDERVWAEELSRRFAADGACETFDELRERLAAVRAGAAEGMTSVPPAALVALVAFLAEHPARHELGEALLSDAMRERSLSDATGEELIAWLSERRETPDPEHRHHTLPEELRHIGHRPPRADEA